VDLNLTSGSGTDNSTVQLTAGSNITLTRNSANEITIASTASGDTYDLNATADGSGTDNSTVQFTAGTGMTLTRTGAQEITFASAAGVTMTTASFTGNGSTATYALGATPTDENYTMAYISGVYQLKSSYTVSGSNITFDTNVPNGASIEIVTTT